MEPRLIVHPDIANVHALCIACRGLIEPGMKIERYRHYILHPKCLDNPVVKTLA